MKKKWLLLSITIHHQLIFKSQMFGIFFYYIYNILNTKIFHRWISIYNKKLFIFIQLVRFKFVTQFSFCWINFLSTFQRTLIKYDVSDEIERSPEFLDFFFSFSSHILNFFKRKPTQSKINTNNQISNNMPCFSKILKMSFSKPHLATNLKQIFSNQLKIKKWASKTWFYRYFFWFIWDLFHLHIIKIHQKRKFWKKKKLEKFHFKKN